MAETSPQPITPTPPSETPKEPEAHRAHTYDDDVMHAMNATDATTVQELLSTAREREAAEKTYHINKIKRHWYSLFSIVFTLCAAACFAYALYHYTRLTVPVEQGVSVGVFPSTSPIVASETSIDAVVSGFAGDTSIPENKPTLVPLVTDATSLSPISKNEFFTFINAKPTEPFVYMMDTVRLGVMNDGIATSPFVILSVPDAQVASKEFLIAEHSLVQLFYRALSLPNTEGVAVGKEFKSTYLYNQPVRLLSATNPLTGSEDPVFLYGYVTGNVIVITTKPSILKAVYDTIVQQQ